MLQIKYNNEFLDLARDQSSEMEKNSPLFLGLDTLLAEYSTPIAIKYTDKNARLLGFLFFDLTIKTKSTFAVEIYSGITFITQSSLIIESAGMNKRFASKSSIAGYLLTGISNFFTYIKDKKLTDLTLGGTRTFAYTTSDPTDASDGYWQHFQDTWNFLDDYVMLPTKNQAFTEDDPQFSFTPGWMNKLDIDSNLDTRQPVFPFPKLSYVLNEIMEEAGWHLDTTGLNDTEWEKLLLYSEYLVSTGLYTDDGAGHISRTDFAHVNIELSKAMAENVTCSRFIFEICKRYFWFPITDSASRTVKLIALKETRNGVAKDWTKFADAIGNSDFSATKRIFAFKNDFEGEDQYPSSMDLKPWGNVGYATSHLDLPALTGGGEYDNQLFYVFLENKYYSVDWDGTSRSWVPAGDNIYDFEPDNATDTFETAVTTLPIQRVQFENGHYGYVHLVNQELRTVWGIRTILYHGMAQQFNESGEALGVFYPYGSCINTPAARTPQLTWSNVWKHTDFINEYGIVDYWANPWLKMIISGEVVKRNFYVPLYELIKFQWNDIILVHSIPFLIKSYLESLDKQGFIQATMQRIILS
jgi:hypothetical protein